MTASAGMRPTFSLAVTLHEHRVEVGLTGAAVVHEHLYALHDRRRDPHVDRRIRWRGVDDVVVPLTGAAFSTVRRSPWQWCRRPRRLRSRGGSSLAASAALFCALIFGDDLLDLGPILRVARRLVEVLLIEVQREVDVARLAVRRADVEEQRREALEQIGLLQLADRDVVLAGVVRGEAGLVVLLGLRDDLRIVLVPASALRAHVPATRARSSATTSSANVEAQTSVQMSSASERKQHRRAQLGALRMCTGADFCRHQVLQVRSVAGTRVQRSSRRDRPSRRQSPSSIPSWRALPS